MQANHGQLTLVDSEIEFSGAALDQARARGRGVGSRRLPRQRLRARRDQGRASIPQQKTDLAGNPQGWLHVRQFAAPSSPRANQGHTYRYPGLCGRQSRCERVCDVVPDRRPARRTCSRDTCGRRSFPASSRPARPTSKPRPTAPKATAEPTTRPRSSAPSTKHEIVFLPKGCYLLTQPLELKPHTKLIGVGQTMSLLVPAKRGRSPMPATPGPLVRTADAADAETVLAFLGLLHAVEGRRARSRSTGAAADARSSAAWRSMGATERDRPPR